MEYSIYGGFTDSSLLTGVHPEIGKFGRDQGALKILPEVPEGNALGVYRVADRKNWSFVDGR
jgi:hypothetical protein